jgi:transglutaminase-like putative cysteine protease
MTTAVLSIRHETTYRYASPAGYTIQRLRMTPRTEPLQRTLQWQVATPGKRRTIDDAFGNSGHIMTMTQPHDEVRIIASGSVEVYRPDRGRVPEKMLLSPLAFTVPTRLTEPTAAVRDFAVRHLGAQHVDTATLLGLADAIRCAVAYHPGATETSSTADDALGLGVGVCQDHAHLFIACCHAMALPVRYVSGYVYPGAVPHAASHAWVDAWVDDVDYSGWVAIDVTHAALQTEDYCRLAVGRDYESVAPVRGMRRGGGQEVMTVDVSVNRI